MAACPFHHESHGVVAAEAARLFAHLDDHSRLSSHMSKRSWMLGGGRMDVTIDSGGGQAIGSHILLAGRAFGVPLSLDEVVVERLPPLRKAWETVGEPRLLVVGTYRMGFDVLPRPDDRSELRVFIDYALPTRGVSRWLGRALGHGYARWCTKRMVDDAVSHFATTETGAPR